MLHCLGGGAGKSERRSPPRLLEHGNMGVLPIHLYFSDLRGLDENCARYPGRTKSRGSAFGVSLLAYAMREKYGLALPETSTLQSGRPIFSRFPEIKFSISHTKTHLLCAISKRLVGADVETIRPLRPGLAERLASPEERRDFGFFELWTLRESFFKLTGQGSLLDTRFTRRGGAIIAPDPRVHCHIYHDIPGCVAAVCAYGPDFPGRIMEVKSEHILRAP